MPATDIQCDPSKDYLQEIKSILSSGLLSKAEELINEKEFIDYLKEDAMDLIPIASKYLNEKTHQENVCVFNFAELLLYYMAMYGNPKEVLLGLLGQIESCSDDVVFQTLLTPLQRTLENIPNLKKESFEWALSTTYRYVMVKPLPVSYHFEGEERKLYELDTNFIELATILEKHVLFLNPFVQLNSLKSKITSNNKVQVLEIRKTLINHILHIFDRPLVFLNLSSDLKSSVRETSEAYMKFLSALLSNFCKLFSDIKKINSKKSDSTENQKLCTFDEDLCPSNLAYGTLYYLVLAEHLEYEHIPCVYDNIYLFHEISFTVISLLKRSEDCAVHKGLLLGLSLVNRLCDGVMTYKMLELQVHSDLTAALINITVFNPLKEYRQLSVKLLNEYIRKFGYRGRYQLFCNLLNTNIQSCVLGYLVDQVRQTICNDLKENSVNPYFSGKNLFVLLQLCLKLQNAETTDLLENYDHVLASLNLVRYLVLRDTDNVTGFWDHISYVEKTFMEPLHSALDLSRAHFEIKLKELKEERRMRPKSCKSEILLTVGGQTLPNLPPNNQEDIVKSALITLDMINSVYSRVSSCISSSYSAKQPSSS